MFKIRYILVVIALIALFWFAYQNDLLNDTCLRGRAC